MIGADLRCPKCNKYLPDRCTCNGQSIEERRLMSTHTSPDKSAEAERDAFVRAYLAEYPERGEIGARAAFNGDAGRMWLAARRAPAPVADGLPPLPVTVPEWDFAAGAVEAGQGSPLDIFVYHNEPAGDSDEANFRAQLQAALDCAIAADRQAHASVPAAGAVQQPVVVPDGWTLVPVEPTDDMILALDENGNDEDTARQAYRVGYKAMLSAAPSPGNTAQPVEQVGDEARDALTGAERDARASAWPLPVTKGATDGAEGQ